MLEYKVFKKLGKGILDKHKKVMNPPKGYHRIKAHLVFAFKFDGRQRARLVVDGHLTPEPIENIYTGVVSLRNPRLVIFLGKLNHLELWGADIGNAYLDAFNDKKLYIVAGPEFQELEGYIHIFLKALYGYAFSSIQSINKEPWSIHPFNLDVFVLVYLSYVNGLSVMCHDCNHDSHVITITS